MNKKGVSILELILIILAILISITLIFKINNKEEVSLDKFVEKAIIDKDSLRDRLIIELKDRPENLSIDYYGDDIKTGNDIGEVITEIQNTGTYHTNNMNASTRIDGEIQKKDGTYKLELMDIGYRTNDKEEEFVNREAEKVVKKIIKKDMSEFEKVKAIYDYIVSRKIYTVETEHNGQSAYPFFKENKGVCHAFALSAAKLFDKAEIDNVFIIGKANNGESSELHAWNKVRIDGIWYNLDTTWGHPKDEKGYKQYEYFLISDAKFYKTHKPLSQKYEPNAIDSKYDMGIQ